MSARTPITILDAPSNLGLMPQPYGSEPGVRFAPDALRRTGLLTALGVTDGGRVEPPPYTPDIESISDVRNGPAIRNYSLGALVAGLQT